MGRTRWRRLAVISPHCDDAVFGCGDLLGACPGGAVITVFAGSPPTWGAMTAWDAAAGFAPGDDVMAARRVEDRAAIEILAATPVWLDFCDSQYRRPAEPTAITAALVAALEHLAPDAVAAPLGLFHSDHRLASDAALAARRSGVEWWFYEDAIYRRIDGVVDARLAAIVRGGATPIRADVAAAPSSPRKRAAIGCYVSQLRALSSRGYPGYADAFAPERYWRITR